MTMCDLSQILYFLTLCAIYRYRATARKATASIVEFCNRSADSCSLKRCRSTDGSAHGPRQGFVYAGSGGRRTRRSTRDTQRTSIAGKMQFHRARDARFRTVCSALPSPRRSAGVCASPRPPDATGSTTCSRAASNDRRDSGRSPSRRTCPPTSPRKNGPRPRRRCPKMCSAKSIWPSSWKIRPVCSGVSMAALRRRFSICLASIRGPTPIPGQSLMTSPNQTFLFIFSGQNGHVRHCFGRVRYTLQRPPARKKQCLSR